jgi:hypothetical protein
MRVIFPLSRRVSRTSQFYPWLDDLSSTLSTRFSKSFMRVPVSGCSTTQYGQTFLNQTFLCIGHCFDVSPAITLLIQFVKIFTNLTQTRNGTVNIFLKCFVKMMFMRTPTEMLIFLIFVVDVSENIVCVFVDIIYILHLCSVIDDGV